MHAQPEHHSGSSATRSTAERGQPATAQRPRANPSLPASAQLTQLAAIVNPSTTNRTGLPPALKAGVESLSGVSLDHVRVHRNSSKPAQLSAHAFAQGSDIHLAPGQEKHLPHEAWHVVQQAQGRVKPTAQLKGIALNDDSALEREADVMGTQALQTRPAATASEPPKKKPSTASPSAPRQLRKRHSANPSQLPRKISSPRPELPPGPTAQRIIDSTAFRLQTPGTWKRWRKAVATIDTALDTYHAAPQATKLATLDALINTINTYIAGKANDPDNDRLPPANTLLTNAYLERPTVNRLNVLYLNHITGSLADMVHVAGLTLAELTAVAAAVGGGTITALGTLIGLATAASGAGTPAVRLQRVIAANPLAPRTVLGLTPLLAAQKDIDEKILRGRITGGALGAVGAPNAGHRTLIGGHSQGLIAEPDIVVSNTVNNPNGTDYVSFRKLIRGDATGFAANVQGAAPGNIVAAVLAETGVATALHGAPPALILPARMPAAIQLQRQAAQAAALGNMVAPMAAVGVASAAAIAAAPAAAAAVNNAAAQAPFIDALTALYRDARALLNAGIQAEANTGTALAAAALVRLNAAILNFETTGPVLSMNKNSTLGPPGWTDDQVLAAGDATAATPATLIRFNPPANNPVNNDLVDSKHEHIVNGVVWVVMKENVRYTSPPPALAGGTVISSYPTSLTVIPANPVVGAMDADRFGPLH